MEEQKMNTITRWWITSVFVVCSFVVQAEQKKVFDGPGESDYEVHYIAFNSTFLDADIAKQYGLVRSKALGVVNISVIRREPDGKTRAVRSVIEGRVSNEIQQQNMMGFQQVTEGPAIYYLAQIQFSEAKRLTFDLTLYPEGQSEALHHRFSHVFFND